MVDVFSSAPYSQATEEAIPYGGGYAGPSLLEGSLQEGGCRIRG